MSKKEISEIQERLEMEQANNDRLRGDLVRELRKCAKEIKDGYYLHQIIPSIAHIALPLSRSDGYICGLKDALKDIQK